jgi:hypothetical protein
MNHERAQYVKQDIAKHKQHEKEKTTVCWTMNNKTQTKWTRREQYVEQEMCASQNTPVYINHQTV